MKNGSVLIITGLIILCMVWSCYYDNEEYLYPQVNNLCDTTSITFTGSVKPILTNSCFGCHSNSTSSLGNNIRLEDYADVKTRVSDGSLIGTINHTGIFPPMPDGASKLEDCKINIIQKWIDLDSPNN